MFEVPFSMAVPGARRTTSRAPPPVVITKDTNDRLFGGANSWAKPFAWTLEPYTISACWMIGACCPRFYDLAIRPFGDGDAIFMPFTRAIEKPHGNGR